MRDSGFISKKNLITTVLFLPAIGIYSYLCYHLNFVQDDAYISYRYIANFLNGYGLVYNIGERIEGFTNFGWVIYLILWGALGFNYILVSKITGFLLGAGIIILTYFISKEIFTKNGIWFSLLAVYLVGINQSLAYWSSAGLETAAFAFFVMLSFYFYLKQSWGLIATLVLVVWIRPEGALVAGLLIITEAITRRKLPYYSFSCAAIAFLLSLPYVIFKLTYYGSIFPNPFYAKTGWNIEQLSSGFEYVTRFFSHYGFWGIGFILPLAFYRTLPKAAKAMWVFTTLYIFYILFVGGDVLKVHRFFVPLFGNVAILLAVGIWMVSEKLNNKLKPIFLIVISILCLTLTYSLPRKFVRRYYILETALTQKMSFLASQMKTYDKRNFSVAIPTIGIFGYSLLEHEIIDMLGLTDSTIARHSEAPIPGMSSTWKERKHNSRYLLSKKPDYIVFSTGNKPSAPAERALLVYDQFLKAYRIIGWKYKATKYSPEIIVPVFKKFHKITGEIVPKYPIQYVQWYTEALNYSSAGNYKRAILLLNKALKVTPPPPNLSLLCDKAYCYTMLGQHDSAMTILSDVLAVDSFVFQAHKDLYVYAQLLHDNEKLRLHQRWLNKLTPWYLKQEAAQNNPLQ